MKYKHHCFGWVEKQMKWTLSLLFLLAFLWCQSQSDSAGTKATKHHLYFQKGLSTFSLMVNYRIRGEFQHHYDAKTYGTDSSELFLLSRLRVGMEYNYSDWFNFFTEIQDARVFGSSFSDPDFAGKNNPYHDPFDINKLLISIRPIYSLELTVGRQALNYADRRVFGPGDWGNTGRYIWDAVKLNYGHKYFSSSILYGYNIKHEPDVWPNMGKEGPYALAVYNSIKQLPFGLEVFYIYETDQTGTFLNESDKPGNLYLNYLGGRIMKNTGRWNILFLGAYQFGKEAGDPVNAYGAVTQIGYSLNTRWNPKLLATYIYGSGDKDPTDNKTQTFYAIFSGADTDLYSWMNFAFWKNIHQPRLDLLLRPFNKTLLRLEYHLYWLASETDAWYFPGKAMRLDAAGQSGNFIGQEVDITLQAKIFYWLEALGGYCVFLPGEFARNTGAHPNAEWVFLQLTFMY